MIRVTTFSRYKLLILTALVEGVVLIIALLTAWFFGIKLFPLTQKIFHDIAIGTLGALMPLALFVFLLSEMVNNTPLLGPLKKTIINDIRIIFSEYFLTVTIQSWIFLYSLIVDSISPNSILNPRILT